MAATRAFDLALFVGAPNNVGDGVSVTSMGPPFTTQFTPLVTASAPGVVVGASIPAATAAGQALMSGPGPGFAWTAAVISGSGQGIGEAPDDGTSYLRNSLAWSNIIDCGTF